MILASGSGSTAEAFIHATQDGRVDAEVGGVVCDKPPEEAGIYDRVERLNKQYGLEIEMDYINGELYPEGPTPRGQTLAESEQINRKAIHRNYDHIALMGYMRIVTGDLLQEWGYLSTYDSPHYGRMSNTHPGPLPETEDTYGVYVSERVLDLGMTASKHTFHLVAEGIDQGPVIAEHPVPILDGDTPESLFDRVQIVEKTALPYALGRFLKEQQETWHGNS
jgi:phosphoribosylglycinamide formyltransferase-1